MSRRHRRPFSPGQWLLKGAAVLVLGFLIAPALIVVPLSFGGDVMTRFPPKHFSLEAYSRFLNGPGWLDATLFSFEGATIVMLAAVLVGTLTAFGLARSTGRMRSLSAVLVLLPALVPTIIFAISVYWLLAGWGLLGTLAGFVLAELMVALPYAIITIRAGVENFDRSLMKAAFILGARPMRVVARILVPLLMPALAAGGLFAFLICFDEVIVAQFISGPGAVPLAKKMWDAMLFQWDSAIPAISTMEIGLATGVLVLVALLRQRATRRGASADRE